jgi:hypothetical protein
MIVGIWQGRTSLAHYKAYTEFLKRIAIPDFQKTVGPLATHRRDLPQ